MNPIKKSIKKKAAAIYGTVIVLCALLLFSMLYCLDGYRKNMKFYTDSYYSISQVSASANEYKSAMGEYADFDGEYYLSRAQQKFRTAKEKFSILYNNRFEYSNSIRYVIESASSAYSGLDVSMKKIGNAAGSEEVCEIYNTEIKEYVSRIYSDVDSIMDAVLKDGNSSYEKFDVSSKVVQILAIVAFVAMILLLVYSIYFMHKKIVTPACDIYEWTRLFKDGYCDMAELKYDTEDEIGKLAESFNIVKRKLTEANALKAQYDDLVRKLNTEEEHKKNFVQQLYTEKRDKEAISTAAKHDGLTGLYNRRTFDGIVDEYITKRPTGAEGALFLIDMDNFKNVNDTLGHLAGDEALKLLAGNMRVVFNGAYLGRYGGDEFIVFVANYKSIEELEAYASDLCEKMYVRFGSEDKDVQLAVSIGVAITDGITEYSELYMKADRALYYSKEHGRNQYKFESTL